MGRGGAGGVVGGDPGSVAVIELRAEGRRLVGTVVDYRDTADRQVFMERFVPGSLDVSDVLLYAQHERGQPLARTPTTMQLTDTPEALTMVATLPATRLADDVLRLVEARVLRGLSMGFVCVRDRYEGDTRVVERAVLDHVGVVDRPSYDESLVSVRRWQGYGDGYQKLRSFGSTPLRAPRSAPVRRRHTWL